MFLACGPGGGARRPEAARGPEQGISIGAITDSVKNYFPISAGAPILQVARFIDRVDNDF